LHKRQEGTGSKPIVGESPKSRSDGEANVIDLVEPMPNK
jgi:hypothetical protein